MSTRAWALGAAVVVLVLTVLVWGLLQRAATPPPPGVDEAATAAAPKAAPGAAPRGLQPAPLLPPTAARDALPAWLAQPEVPQRRVAGRVTFEGNPVAGAQVRLEASVRPEGLRMKQLRTSSDGRFDFGEQPALEHTVAAASPGRTGASVTVELRDPTRTPPPDALELVLTACDARLSGRVLDSGGGPIEHAQLRAEGGLGVETSARGEFELCLPPGPNQLTVEAAGYGALRVAVLVLGHTTRDVILTPEAYLVGRVITEEAGAPVPDALVSAWAPAGGDGPAGGAALTGPDGRFRLSVAPAEYRLVASAAGASTATPVMATALVGRVSDEVVLRLKTRARLHGHVRSAGKPVAGAHVQAIGAASGRGADGFSQADGSFVLTNVPLGKVVFTAAPWEVVSPKGFTVAKPDDSVELEVQPLAALHGVVTRGGKPVAGAEVRVNTGMQGSSALSDGAGQYVVRGLAAGTYSVVAQSERAGAFVAQKVTLASQEDRRLDLELTSAATISGRVVSETGAPVPGAMVVYTLARTGDEGRSITDADGRFNCNLMSGGGEYQPVVLPSQVARRAYTPVTPPLPGATLADGSSKVEGVTLAIKYERLSISGRVVDPGGTPVPDVTVRAVAVEPGQPPVFNPWVALPSAMSDAQGAFTIDALTAGSWALNARTPDGAEATAPDIAAGAKDVVLTVRPPGGIEGTLVGYEEPPVVYVRAPGQPKFVPAQVEGTSFHVSVPAGTYVVTAMNLHEGDAQRVEVREGAATKVTMTSHGRATVTGSVVEHGTRAPVAGFICHTVVRSGADPGLTNWDETTAPKTDARGEFVVDPAPAGDLTIGCFGDWSAWSGASAQVSVPRGGRLTVALETVRRVPETYGDLGVTLNDVAPTITSVTPQGPAGKAGLAAGDVVASVDGVPVGALGGAGVAVLLSNHAPGSQVTLGLVRGSQPRTVTLTTVTLPTGP